MEILSGGIFMARDTEVGYDEFQRVNGPLTKLPAPSV